MQKIIRVTPLATLCPHVVPRKQQKQHFCELCLNNKITKNNKNEGENQISKIFLKSTIIEKQSLAIVKTTLFYSFLTLLDPQNPQFESLSILSLRHSEWPYQHQSSCGPNLGYVSFSGYHDVDFRKLHKILHLTHIYVFFTRQIAKKLSALESL